MKHTQKIKSTIRSLALAVFGCLLMAGFTTNAGTIALDIDFESSEGYAAGALPGQNGWVQSDSDGAADMAATVIDPAGNMASNGSAATKFTNPDAVGYYSGAPVTDDGLYSPPLDGCAGESGCCTRVFEQSFWVRTVDESFDGTGAFDFADGSAIWVLDVRITAANSSGSGESNDMGALAFFADAPSQAFSGYKLGMYWIPSTGFDSPGIYSATPMTPLANIEFGMMEHVGIRYEFIDGGADVVQVFSGSNANAGAPGGMGTEITMDVLSSPVSCESWEGSHAAVGVNTNRFYSRISSEASIGGSYGEFTHNGLAIDELNYELVGCGDDPPSTTPTTTETTTTPTTTETTTTPTTTTPTTTETTTTPTTTETTTTPTTTEATTTPTTTEATTTPTTTEATTTPTTTEATTTPTTTETTTTATTTTATTTTPTTTETTTTPTTTTETTTTVVTTSTTTLSGDCACDESGILSAICQDVESLDLHSVEALSDLIRSKVEEAGAGHCSPSEMDTCTQTIKTNMGL